jgi:uncharacterized protein YcbX
MGIDPLESRSPQGSVVGLWRYPVKSMMGEELNATDVTTGGVVGDRHFAVVDAQTGTVAGAKNPRKWGNFFDFRAVYVQPPYAGSPLPAVRVVFPDGTVVTSTQADVSDVLSGALGRRVELAQAEGGADGASSGATAEEYWPDMEGLEHRDTVTEWDMPVGTFFDLATVHVLTTATIDRLRNLYPEGRFEARRFRPNIVVATEGDGFVENEWVGHTLTIGDHVRLQITGACPRCVMTTLSQGDLPKDAGILRTAARHNGVNVGVYAEVIEEGTVHRGDAVTIL